MNEKCEKCSQVAEGTGLDMLQCLGEGGRKGGEGRAGIKGEGRERRRRLSEGLHSDC